MNLGGGLLRIEFGNLCMLEKRGRRTEGRKVIGEREKQRKKINQRDRKKKGRERNTKRKIKGRKKGKGGAGRLIL